MRRRFLYQGESVYTINLYDSAFAHAHCSTYDKIPKKMKYVRNQID